MTASLFDAPRQGALDSASGWLHSLLAGPAVTAVCVIAVALLGMAMLTGRIAPRQGAQVVLGSFLLLGAASLAEDLRGLAGDGGVHEAPVELVIDIEPRPPLPPAEYDPYAGASLRRQ